MQNEHHKPDWLVFVFVPVLMPPCGGSALKSLVVLG